MISFFFSLFLNEGNDPNESVIYIVGEDTFCETAFDGYCNGPLKPETKYSMKIRAYTAGGYQDSPPLKFTTGSGTYINLEIV